MVTHLDNDCQAPVFNTLTEKDIWRIAFLACLSAFFWHDKSHSFVAEKKLHSGELCYNHGNDPNQSFQRDIDLQLKEEKWEAWMASYRSTKWIASPRSTKLGAVAVRFLSLQCALVDDGSQSRRPGRACSGSTCRSWEASPVWPHRFPSSPGEASEVFS